VVLADVSGCLGGLLLVVEFGRVYPLLVQIVVIVGVLGLVLIVSPG